MRMMALRIKSAFVVAALIVSSGTALAQTPNRFVLQSLNFDLWCQETVRLEVARCDRRQPEDMERFEAYRATIERYEIPYLQERGSQLRLNSSILHNDPVGNPLRQNPQAQSQLPTPTKVQDAP